MRWIGYLIVVLGVLLFMSPAAGGLFFALLGAGGAGSAPGALDIIISIPKLWMIGVVFGQDIAINLVVLSIGIVGIGSGLVWRPGIFGSLFPHDPSDRDRAIHLAQCMLTIVFGFVLLRSLGHALYWGYFGRLTSWQFAAHTCLPFAMSASLHFLRKDRLKRVVTLALMGNAAYGVASTVAFVRDRGIGGMSTIIAISIGIILTTMPAFVALASLARSLFAPGMSANHMVAGK
jgi:hypothetical protein